MTQDVPEASALQFALRGLGLQSFEPVYPKNLFQRAFACGETLRLTASKPGGTPLRSSSGRPASCAWFIVRGCFRKADGASQPSSVALNPEA